MTPLPFDVDAWEERVGTHRADKDEFFATAADSPIPEEKRADFDGLSYFPIDIDYRFDARLEFLDEPESVSLQTNRGPDREFERVGTVGFTLDGDLQTLLMYRAPGIEDLFVPFGDETNGVETWEYGRYLSFDFEGVDADVEEIVPDFNLAYHPFCVYNDEYVCVLRPPENELPVRIPSGERL